VRAAGVSGTVGVEGVEEAAISVSRGCGFTITGLRNLLAPTEFPGLTCWAIGFCAAPASSVGCDGPSKASAQIPPPANAASVGHQRRFGGM
jgi:hypothetical protein